MQSFRLYTYDVWGNSKDGYDINNTFRTNIVLELKPNFSDKELIKQLNKHYFSRKHQARSFLIDGDDQFITVNSAKDYYPICELRLETE